MEVLVQTIEQLIKKKCDGSYRFLAAYTGSDETAYFGYANSYAVIRTMILKITKVKFRNDM